MMTSPPPQPLPAYGRLIEGVRDARGISQRAAARLAGVGRQTWIDAARGYKLRDNQQEPVSPEPRTIARMAHAVGVTPERLETEGQHPGAAKVLREILRSQPEAARIVPVPDPAPPLDLATADDSLIEAMIAAWPEERRKMILEGIWNIYRASGEGREEAVDALTAVLRRGIPRLREQRPEEGRATSLTDT